jgi:hypothetical protein
MAATHGARPLGLRRARELLVPEARAAAPRPDAARDGYLDLLPQDLESTGATQDLMTTSLVPAIYERYWRPALARLAKGLTGPGMAEEVRIARLLLGWVPETTCWTLPADRGTSRASSRTRSETRASWSGSMPRTRCSSAAPPSSSTPAF